MSRPALLGTLLLLGGSLTACKDLPAASRIAAPHRADGGGARPAAGRAQGPPPAPGVTCQTLAGKLIDLQSEIEEEMREAVRSTLLERCEKNRSDLSRHAGGLTCIISCRTWSEVEERCQEALGVIDGWMR